MFCSMGTSNIQEFFDITRGAQLTSFLPFIMQRSTWPCQPGGNGAIAFSIERQHMLHRHLRSLTAESLFVPELDRL